MKKKVLMVLGVMVMCGLVGCGSKEVGEKETFVNQQEDNVDKGTKNPYKEVEMSEENVMITATATLKYPKEWIREMSGDFSYTNKGKVFMLANDGFASQYMESCNTLDDMPNACMLDMKDKLARFRTICGYGSGSSLESNIVGQELVIVDDKEMIKVKGYVKYAEEGKEELKHSFIAYYTFHEPYQDKTEPYPVYFAYFYPEGTDETEIEAYAYESAATLELTE